MSTSNISKDLKEEDLKAFFPDPILIRIGDKDTREVFEFHVEEFTFENRIKFIKIISGVFMDVYKKRPDIAGKGNVEALMILIEIAGDRMIEVYSLVIDKDAEWIKKNLTLKREIEILTAIFEVNEIPLLIGQIQKVIEKAQNKK